jgi:TatD DNase family protein
MIDLIDTHCHIQSIGAEVGEKGTLELWSKAKDLTAEKVIDNAKAVGANSLIVVGCDLSDSQLAVKFVENRPGCWASIGIHPHEAKASLKNPDTLSNLASLSSQPKVVAIGECGLDYYYQHSPKTDQFKVLESQLAMASQANLPIIFHVRDAFDDFWPIYDKFPGLAGVVHSFTDNQANLEACLQRGLYIGVNGIITFIKEASKLEVYKSIPQGKLLLETDSPFLTPVPYRGNINEPMRVGIVAEYLASLRGEELGQLASVSSTNARRLFNLT